MHEGVQAVGICLLFILAAPASAATGDVSICTHGEREAQIAACSSAIQSGRMRGRDLAWAMAVAVTLTLIRATLTGRWPTSKRRSVSIPNIPTHTTAADASTTPEATMLVRSANTRSRFNSTPRTHGLTTIEASPISRWVKQLARSPTIAMRSASIPRFLAAREPGRCILAHGRSGPRAHRLRRGGSPRSEKCGRTLWSGPVYRGKGDNDRALAESNEAVRLDPQSSIAHDIRGFVYHVKGDEDGALADYGEAIRLDPKSPWPHNDRGISYFARGEKTLALADYDAAIRLNPKYAYPYFYRGDLYRDQGDLGRALSEYQTASRLLPEGDWLKSQVVSKIAALQPAAVSPTKRVPAERRVALVIGNADYKNAALVNPSHDADLVSASLRKIGFDVTEVKNADFAAFQDAIAAFVAKEDHADVALFYFAGHGFAIPATICARATISCRPRPI